MASETEYKDLKIKSPTPKVGFFVLLVAALVAMTGFLAIRDPDFINHFSPGSISSQEESEKPFDWLSVGAKAGKINVINFWASTCGPCVQELPSLIKLKGLRADQVQLIFINMDTDIDEKNAFLKSFPDLLDASRFFLKDDSDFSIAQSLKIDKLPETVILGCDLQKLRVVVGAADWSSAESLSYFDELSSHCK